MSNQISKLLSENEEVLLTAGQSRILPGGSLNTPNSISVTNKRVIFSNPKWLGLKVELIDFMYKDLGNVKINRGLFSSEIELTPRFESDKIKLPAVSKKIADQLFGIIRNGISGDYGLDHNVVIQKDDAVTKLEKLSKMKERGMISEEEFKQAKTRLLGEI